MRAKLSNVLRIALCFSILLISHPCAMTLDELPITGTIADVDAVNQYIAWYPSSVAILYTQKGGRIVVIPCKRLDSIARRYDNYSTNVIGLYVCHSKKIYLASTHDIAVNLVHELGHFLYQETRPTWSNEDKLRWTDTEDFAMHYSHRDADFRSIECRIERLLEVP